MATTTTWGSEVQSGTTRAAKMSIDITQTNTPTTSTVTIAVYLHTRYAVQDSGNNYYFDMNTTSATTDRGSVKIDHPNNDYDGGRGWSPKNVTKLGQSTFNYNRGTASQTISCAAKISNVNYIKATPSVTASFTIPALDSYNVVYNVNGGSGSAPATQKKYYGKTLTLQPATANPTRTGYTFKNWNTKADGTGTSYSAGASYTANAAATLYAQWTINTYKVSYNYNVSGSTGAVPGNQTKTYGTDLTLSDTTPDRSNYNFVKWNTKADGTGTSYNPGNIYSDNTDLTLYAIWEIAYIKPRITNFTAQRCGQDGVPAEDGKCVHITASWECDDPAVEILAGWSSQNGRSGDYPIISPSDSISGQEHSGFVDIVIGDNQISTEYSYNISLYVRDGDDTHSFTKVATISSSKFHIDCKPGPNPGVAIGKAAELEGVFDVGLTSRFLGNRYCMSSPGVASTAGYVLVAKIEITAANADTPITFVMTQRTAMTPMTVHIRLNNPTATASGLSSIRYEGTNYGAFLVHTDTLVWDLYVQKVSAYDTITIQDWYTSKSMDSRIIVTFPGTLVTEIPKGIQDDDGYYRATPAVLNSIIDCIMPVGFVLTLYSHADPNDMYPGTTWLRIQNAFLWGCDASGKIGQTGGEKTHVLTVNEIPSHNHAEQLRVHGYSGWADYTTTGYTVMFDYATDNKYFSKDQTRKSALVAAGATTTNTGGGAAHNNMPPYVQVSIWHRTA